MAQIDPAAPRAFERSPVEAAIIAEEPLRESDASPVENHPDRESPLGEKRLVPIDSAGPRQPRGNLLQTLFLPADIGGLSGRPITLATAVGPITARAEREAIVLAYWRLSAAIASYHVERQVWQTIESVADSVPPEGPDAAFARAALASASARIQEAKVEVSVRQRELAQRTGRAADAPLPLCSDLPHIGTYATRFERIYRNRSATAVARRIHETLPLQASEIKLRAAAVTAASDVVDAVLDPQRQPLVGRTRVVVEIDRLCQQRRAFVKAVARYNRDIAAYALPLAPESFSAERVVAMLIKPAASHPTAAASLAHDPASLSDGWSPVRPAEYIERRDNAPAITPPPMSLTPGEPTLAPPLADPSHDEAGGSADGPNRLAPAEGEPTLAEPSDNPFSPPRPAETPEFPRAPADVDDQQPPVEEEEEPATDGGPLSTATPRESTRPPRPLNHTVARAVQSDDAPGEIASTAEASSFRLYSALDNSRPATRTRRLNELLHWTAPVGDESSAESVTLTECLDAVPESQRRQAIGAYWSACFLSARLRMYREYVGRLDVLQSMLLQAGNPPHGPTEMLQLRALKLSAKADVALAETELAEARLSLTAFAAKPPAAAPLVLATTPLAGRYLLRVESLPAELSGATSTKRLLEQIPAQQAALDERSAAVVLGDRAGAEFTAEYLEGNRPLDDVRLANEQQMAHTNSFLESIRNYNRSIADYALAVLPKSSSPTELARALVNDNSSEQ